ncbi:MAG TPA: lytic transglycosylase domain-containing protein [Stellaceae bacterium]
MVALAAINRSADAASPRVPAKMPAKIAALARQLTHENPPSIEIVTFADRRLPPVKVVRGAARLAIAAIPATTAKLARPAGGGSVETVAFANRAEPPVTVLRGSPARVIGSYLFAKQSGDDLGLFTAVSGADLDRVAFAVDGAESSHGTDPAMWRADFAGPEGPMQVSAAAAIDAGGGDRFDLTQNRLLGRAYLARLYRRYGDWPDAVAAYDWGPRNVDAWIDSGRPLFALPLEVERYRDRVVRDAANREAPLATAWSEHDGTAMSSVQRSGK